MMFDDACREPVTRIFLHPIKKRLRCSMGKKNKKKEQKKRKTYLSRKLVIALSRDCASMAIELQSADKAQEKYIVDFITINLD